MDNTYLAESEIQQKFSHIVAKSVRIEASLVTPEAYLDDLGAESLDVIEITMETETEFGIWLPEKSILDTAQELFGPDVLEKNGYLTDAGKRLMKRRMPAEDAASFAGEVAVKDLRRYFLKVNTWVRMIQSLMEHTPRKCASCGGAFGPGLGLRLKCLQCGSEVSLRSGDDVNREWVQEYYEREHRPKVDMTVSQAALQ